MPYDLSQLVGWARRTGGDVITSTSESITSDGTRRIRLQSDGFVLVTAVDADADPLPPDAWDAAGNQVTLTTAPIEGTTFDVTYNSATFSDPEILDYLIDAAMTLKGDVKQSWGINAANHTIVDDSTNPSFFPPDHPDDPAFADPSLLKLIVFRAAVGIYTQKNAKAADDAIMIKDGDTTINTSLAARATDSVLKRMVETYEQDLRRYRTEKFCGAAQGDAYEPFRVLQRHREDGTLTDFGENGWY
jgi:hypothetical protein